MINSSLVKSTYNPRVEAISPTPCGESQSDYTSSTFRTSKDELLQNIDKIDREISQTETQIVELKERKKQLELKAASRDSSKDVENVDNSSETRQLSIAQLIYSENRRKARDSHATLSKLGPNFELPLYNQPSDSPVYHHNIEKFKAFKSRLLLYFKRRHEERKTREKQLLETYERLMSEWLKKLEKIELNPSKKAKDNKTREFFEKQFPELRKQREDRERLSRAGQRIRSDVDMEEIMDGLQEQELEDRKMRSCAVIPPIMHDIKSRRHRFINLNGLVDNPLEEYKELQLVNVWLDHEKELFREKFLQHPKNFGLIASYLERKTVPDCVHYYYLSKKRENYKQLLRKQVKKRTRALVKQQQQQQAQQQVQQQQQASQLQNELKDQTTGSEIAQSTSGTGVTNESSQNNIVTDVPNHSSSSSSSTTALKCESKDSNNSENQSGISSAVSLPSSTVTSKNTSSSSSSSKGLHDLNGKRDLNSKRHQGHEEDISDNEDNKYDGPVIQCCACGDTIPPSSKCSSITNLNYHLYGINLDEVKGELKVCLNCRFKHIRKECPIQSCKTAKRKVKRLKLLPQQWFDLSTDLKQTIAKEMNIHPDIRKCCTRCVIRISRRIGAISPLLTYTRKSLSNEFHDWKDEEIARLKEGLSVKGKNWKEIASLVGSKDADQCKEFYFNYKYKLNLNQSIESYWSVKGDPNPQPSDSEDYFKDNSEEDDEATSSADESLSKLNNEARVASSSNSPPIKISTSIESAPTQTPVTNTTVVTTAESLTTSTSESTITKPRNSSSVSADGSDTSCFPENKLTDLRAISTSQGSLKSDYDSSATVSADEGRGNGEDDLRNSPPSSKIPPPQHQHHQHQQQRANSAMPAFPPSNHVIIPGSGRILRPASHDPAFTLEPGLNHPNRPMEGLVAQQRYRNPPFLIHHDTDPIRPSNPITAHKVKSENAVVDLFNRIIENSIRTPTPPSKPLSLPLDLEGAHSGPFNSSGSGGPPMPPPALRETHPMILDNSNLPIYPHPEIKKELPSEPCKFDANLQPSTSNDVRIPRFNPHPYIPVKPEGLAMMASYQPTYPPGVPFQPPPLSDPDNEIQDLSKKTTRKLEEHYSQGNLPMPKRKRPDSSPNPRANEFKNSPVPAHLPPTPPPAHSNQLKRTTIPDLSVSNLSTSDGAQMNRQVDPPRMDESNFMYSDRSNFPPMMGQMNHGPSNSPLLRPALRTHSNKTPLSNPSPVIHTPPPPLIASNKSYPFSSGVQLSPKPSLRDRVISPQMVSASGSITQGTPIIMSQHGPLHSNQFNPPRYEGLYRQLAPTYPKDSGSITLGTPVPQDASKRKNELPPRQDNLGKPPYPGPGPLYEPGPMDPYYRRMPGSNMPYPTPPNQPYHGPPMNFPPNEGHLKPKFQVESQSSTNQIMIDFNTSKQMQPRQLSSADVKEPHSISSLLMRPAESNPHISPPGRVPGPMYPFAPPTNLANMSGAPPPQAMMGNNESSSTAQASRFMLSNPSRSSPTQEHWISKAGPNPNYPLVKRQNVIQQYNAPGSKQSVIQSVKSNSPRDSGLRSDGRPSPRFTTSSPATHDAFQTLVDTAVAQKSIAIPPSSRENQQRMGIMNLARSVHHPQQPESLSIETSSNDQMGKNFLNLHQRLRPAPEPSNLNFGMEDRMRLLEADKHCLMPNNESQSRPGKSSSANNSEEDRFMDNNKFLLGPSEALSPQTSLRLPFTKESFEKELRQQDNRLPDSYERKSVEAVEVQGNQSKSLSRAQLIELSDNEASRIFSQSFQKDENPRNHSSKMRELTAANIIDAIITRQINQSGEEGPGKGSSTSQQSFSAGDNSNKTSDVRPIVSTSGNENAVSYSRDESNWQHEREDSSSKSFEGRPGFEQTQQPPPQQQQSSQQPAPQTQQTQSAAQQQPPPPQQSHQLPTNHGDKNDSSSKQNFKDHIATIISKSYSNQKVTPIAQSVTIIPCSQENNPQSIPPLPPSQVLPLLQIPVNSLIQPSSSTSSSPSPSLTTTTSSSSNRPTVSISRPSSRPGDLITSNITTAASTTTTTTTANLVTSEASTIMDPTHSNWKLREALQQQQSKSDIENAQPISIGSSSGGGSSNNNTDNNNTSGPVTSAASTANTTNNTNENKSEEETVRSESPYNSSWMSDYNLEPISPP